MVHRENVSFWSDTVPQPHFETLIDNEEAEIAVIGAGIVGILTAWLLQKEGKQVTLVEAGHVADGVTAYTTAKITSQHSLIYQTLLMFLGKEKATRYYRANEEGLAFLRQTMEDLDIDCDWEKRDAVVYATTESGKGKILKEMQAYQRIGIDGYLTYDIPNFPFPITAAIGIPNQAQFHPVKFLHAVLDEFVRLGGTVYERTRALEVKNKERQEVLLEHGNVLRANRVVIATHYPINDEQGLYFSRLKISRSYGVLGKPTKSIPRGMFINVESPTRSIRSVTGENGEELVLVGGNGHPVGRDSKTVENYQDLKDFTTEYFGASQFYYQWSTQDPSTPDKVPYIGQMHRLNQNLFVATGFNKWGMSNGAIGAKLLTDLIVGRENPYSSLYNPTRTKLQPLAVMNLVKENTLVAKELVGGKVAPATKKISDVGLDEGAIIEVDGERLGIYKDSEGNVHQIKPVCTHMGCTVNWNQAERSWDCPCHGSRFSADGSVLEGPAVKPLKGHKLE